MLSLLRSKAANGQAQLLRRSAATEQSTGATCMDTREIDLILKRHKELEDAISMKVKITNEQAVLITTKMLLDRYASALKDDSGKVAAFETVLLYFFDTEELSDIKEALLAS